MKIIAIIEDTGERRTPLDGETFTHLHSLSDGKVCPYLYSHKPSDSETAYVILRVTESDDLEQPLALKERLELIHLRRFAKAVREAELQCGGSQIDDPDSLYKEARHLATRMQVTGMLLADALREAGKLPPDVPSPDEFQKMARAAASLPVSVTADPFATEDEVQF